MDRTGNGICCRACPLAIQRDKRRQFQRPAEHRYVFQLLLIHDADVVWHSSQHDGNIEHRDMVDGIHVALTRLEVLNAGYRQVNGPQAQQ